MKSRILAVLGAGGVLLAVGALAIWKYDPGGPELVASPVQTPTAVASAATPSAQPGQCPVDPAICDFSTEVERVYREGDLRALMSPKSTYYPEVGVLRAASIALGGPLKPRVIAIGCPIDPSVPECSDAFSLVLTSYPADDQQARDHRVLLGFLRDGNTCPS